MAHGDVPGHFQVAVPLFPLRLICRQQRVGQVLHDAFRRSAVDGKYSVARMQPRFLRDGIHHHALCASPHRKAPRERRIAFLHQLEFQVAVPHPGAVLADRLQHQQRGHAPVVISLPQHGDKGRRVVPFLLGVPTRIVIADGQEQIVQKLVAFHVQPSPADVLQKAAAAQFPEQQPHVYDFSLPEKSAFASGAMKSPVGTLSGITVLRKQDGGVPLRQVMHCPHRTDLPDGRGSRQSRWSCLRRGCCSRCRNGRPGCCLRHTDP